MKRCTNSNFQLHPITGDVDSDPKVHMFEAQGLRWKRMRTISAPSFSAQNLKKVFICSYCCNLNFNNTIETVKNFQVRPLIEESVHGLTKCFDEALGKSINIHEYVVVLFSLQFLIFSVISKNIQWMSFSVLLWVRRNPDISIILSSSLFKL